MFCCLTTKGTSCTQSQHKSALIGPTHLRHFLFVGFLRASLQFQGCLCDACLLCIKWMPPSLLTVPKILGVGVNFGIVVTVAYTLYKSDKPDTWQIDERLPRDQGWLFLIDGSACLIILTLYMWDISDLTSFKSSNIKFLTMGTG